jgi:hypothetical protein
MTIELGLVEALLSHQAGPVTAGRWRCGMHLNRFVRAAARDGGRSARSSIRRPSFPAAHGARAHMAPPWRRTGPSQWMNPAVHGAADGHDRSSEEVGS